MLSGPYTVPAVKEDVYGVYTNTTPVEAYRGAGRPEATFMLERMIDRARAIEIGSRSRGGAAAQPDSRRSPTVTMSITGLKYDSGNYQAALDKALAHVGYDDASRGAEGGP